MKRTQALSVFAVTLAIVASACSASPVPAGPAPEAHPKECALLRGGVQQDMDPEDTPEKPWPHTDGAGVTVIFETTGLSDRYERLVQDAASIWSASPCIEALPAAECKDVGNCVSVKEEFASNDGGTDGVFSGRDSGTYRSGGTITLYTRLLDRSTDNRALATIVHEMGHAFGLVHRLDRDSVMNETTNGTTNPVPDAIDFTNLAVIYGAPAIAKEL
ncbi:matrixin family metalloprotease [Arthrobacter sp. ZGTC412]|uniref:matrixin family metalloprotease n=1 Tax=Arthrobacter sp. ZGTC412 TaxID=2058900 RepID=UPI0011AFFD1F|nr:matrixin family metalloprotease [Arthrobacter sp. ZGTC412]